MEEIINTLRHCGIQPTPQRIAVVDYVLTTKDHPSADDVLKIARKKCPTVSRATVYNTLNLMVKKGLLTTQVLREGTVVFDPNVKNHHHFIDDDTGHIDDIPWDALTVELKDKLSDYEIHDFQVIMHGKKKAKK